MVLAFESEQLRDICETEAAAIEALGFTSAEVLRRRLADLDAAATVRELPVGEPRAADDRSEEMIVDLCDGICIFFRANHVRNPRDHTGNIDWSQVSRIRIVRIGAENDRLG